MAEALVTVLLERLASITLNKIDLEYKLVVGVDEDVATLTSNLNAIHAVLEDADKRQVEETNVEHWLDNLKEVSYEMEDVLDEWSTEIRKQQSDQKRDGENEKALTKKVCFSLPSPCFCLGQVNREVNRINHRHDIAQKIKNLNKRLTLIANERQSYNFQYSNRVPDQLVRQKTSSLVDVSFGRENEKNGLVRQLLRESSQDGRGPLIIPIVGMGGIGKTTLSQLVYNDEKVKAHFDKRIWVCVSDPFEEIKIAKAIAEGLRESNVPNSNELQTVVQYIYESIEGKKFLLVLDDMWDPDDSKWEQLYKPLRNGATGSRILVTTRKEEVAIMMGATTQMIHLKELSEQNCWSLFRHIAFFDKEFQRGESEVFEAIGKEIVKKSKGLPLAAKTLGSLMRYKRTRKEWEDVLNSKIWQLREVEHQLFKPLLLSYHDLTPVMKRCLLYCIIVPRNYVINKSTMIEWWMSQDYLNVRGNEEKKIIGERCFKNLIMRSFFQDVEEDDGGNIRRCKMHDIVHDFVHFLAKKEYFFIVVDTGANDEMELPNDKFRHLVFMFAHKGPFPVSFSNCKNVRTLATFDSKITTIGSELILRLKCLRTLNLNNNCIEEVPQEIGGLIHLRYLDLSGNCDLKELPDTICELYNLQTMRLVGCQNLLKLPDAIGKLLNLKQLYVKYCHKLESRGIGELTSLQTLDRFRLRNDPGSKLEDLKNLDQLEGRLRIDNLVFVKDASEAEKAQLVKKKHLLDLKLDFDEKEVHRLAPEAGVEKLNALQPHPALESLCIIRYRGATVFPNWMMSLPNLRRLVLHSCSHCELLPPLGRLPSLESLIIVGMDGVRKVGAEFLGIETQSSLESSSLIVFPRLKSLTFKSMGLWREWEGMVGWREDSQITIMPSLSALHIEHCFWLTTLPEFLPKIQLQNFLINECSILKHACDKGIGKEWHKICHIPNIQIMHT